MRPFPARQIVELTKSARAIAVIDRDISFGYEGTVFTNVNSALSHEKSNLRKLNYIAGLGGRDISKESIYEVFESLKTPGADDDNNRVRFLNLNVDTDE